MSTFVQVAGFGLIVVGVALLSIPAAVITAGVLTVVFGLAMAR
jgi:hypothetical protein